MILRSCFSLAAAVLLLPAFARADVTIVQKIEGPVPMDEITMRIKGDRARVDAGPQLTTIVDGKTGDAVNIMHAQRMVMRVSAADSKKAAAMAAQQLGAKPGASEAKIKLTPSGKTETINGYKTEEYVYDTPTFKASYWVAKDYPRADEIMKAMQALSAQAATASPMGMPDFRDLPGLPIRTNVSMGGQEMVSTITAVRHDPIAESDFEVPKDYQEMKMPDISSMLGGQGAQEKAKSAPKPAASPKK
jgi:hypothetical protein